MRTHRNLLLLNFCLTEKENDDFFYCEYKSLKKYLSRNEIKAIIKSVRLNPKCKVDTGLSKPYIITENSPNFHSVQWSY